MSIMEVMENLVRKSGSWQLPDGKQTTLPIHRGSHPHHQAVLLEVDVTAARRELRVRNRGTHDTATFLAWVVSSIGTSLAESQSVEKPRADVTVLLPRRVGSEIVVVPTVFDNANRRSVGHISSVLQAVRSAELEVSEYVVGRNSGLRHWVFAHSPAFVRRARLNRAIRRHRELGPLAGDAVVSVAGLGGRAKGWFIPTSANSICVGVGAVAPKGVVINGAIHQREVFHMSIVIDNRNVSAELTSRWISSLLRSMESGRELNLN